MKKTSIIILSVLSLILSCKKAENNNAMPTASNSLSCGSVTRASAIVKDSNLDPIILKSIDSIQINQQLFDNYDDMVKVTGGVFEMGGDWIDHFAGGIVV